MGDARTSKRTLRSALMLAALSLVLVASGCGSSDKNTKEAATTPAATATTAATGGPVKVVLDQWSVKPSVTSAKAGKVTFEVQNAGSIEHEMIVVKTTKTADGLGSASRVSEDGSVGEQPEFAGGSTKTVTLKLTPGHYALICNIAGHYKAGMYTDFDVS